MRGTLAKREIRSFVLLRQSWFALPMDDWLPETTSWQVE